VAEYVYKKNGDMASRTITGTAKTDFTYAGNLMDTASGGESFDLDYDENGNMQTGVSATLVYNWDNRLRYGEYGNTSIDIKYDPLGNRIWKQSKDGPTITRKYIVDIVGNLPVILLELDCDDNIKKTYIYANSQIVAQHNGDHTANIYFYLHDRLGSVRQIIDTSGLVKNTYTYEPFGKLFATETAENVTNSFKFTGQYFDDEIDEYYLRARQYDPHIGRFTTRDPVFGQFEDPLSLHAYLYCINEPVNRLDPDGKFAASIGLSVSGNFTLSNIPAGKFVEGALPKGLGGIAEMIKYYHLLLPYYTTLAEHIGYGGTAGAAFVFAKNKEEKGLTRGWSWGTMEYLAGGYSLSTSASAALTVDFGFSWQAQHVTKLGGYFVEAGGSITSPVPGWLGINTGSLTVSRGVNDQGGFNEIYLWTGSLGWGTSTTRIGGEAHAFVGKTWVQPWD